MRSSIDDSLTLGRAGPIRGASAYEACTSRSRRQRCPCPPWQASSPSRESCRRTERGYVATLAMKSDQDPFDGIHLRCGAHVFPDHPWMARCDAQECEGSPLRLPPILFPIPKGVHADAERFGKLSLRESDEPTQGGHVARLKFSAHDALALTPTECAPEIGLGEFRDAFHA